MQTSALLPAVSLMAAETTINHTINTNMPKAKKRSANGPPVDSSANEKTTGSSEVCPICAEYIIDATDTHEGEEALFCDGSCQCWFHRCCAGVSQARYKLISESPEPYLCPTCTFDRQQAVIQDLQSNVQALTEEILQVKASLETLLKVPSCTYTAPGPAAGGEDREKGAVSSKLCWNVVASRKKGTKTKGGFVSSSCMPPKNNVANSTSRRSGCGSAQSNKHAVSGTKEVFTGVRRIWGTMKACTVPTVIKSITRLTGIGSNVQVKRKYKTNDKGKVVKWWYILRAEEAVLNQLEQEWEKVQLQTLWKLEPCYKLPIHPPAQESTQLDTPASQSENVNIPTEDPDELSDNLPPLVSTPTALNQSQWEQAAQQ